MTNKSFWLLYPQLAEGRFVDLTHPFDGDIPHFEHSQPMQSEVVRSIEKDGYLVQRFHFEGQWGTHVDAPSHFFKAARALEEIEVREMFLPLVVLDVHEKVAENPDYAVNLQDIKEWEDRNGKIPANAFVALRTDWSKRWPDNVKMHNRDSTGIQHTPGWSLECLRYLYEERNIAANGHETIDPDPGLYGRTTGWECERYVLGRNCYQIELLANLDLCPESGALVLCAFPKAKGASGFPARVFAICPKN